MPTQTLSDSAAEFLPQNLLRKSFIVQNEDASIDIFIRIEEPGVLAVSTTAHDHRIAPGGSLAINSDTDGIHQLRSRWTAIAASGTPLISFFETEDIER